MPDDPVGAAWLSSKFDVQVLSRMPVISQIGGRRSSQINNGFRLETYAEPMRPKDDPASHLQFHLRHEVPHFEFLARLFTASGPEFVQGWVNEEPTGQYARRAAFLYEWFTGAQLEVPARLGGNYVDAIDAEQLVAASPDQVEKVQRWRVNDNLPGTPAFCPFVVKTEATLKAALLDIGSLVNDLTNEFGEDLLMRASVWMTLRESRSSFAIEGEADKTNRVQRFADVMARRTGMGEMPLSHATLAEMQQEILGQLTTIRAYGVRQSPVFVGETVRYQQVVHYVAPPQNDVAAMLAGLRTFLQRTSGQSPTLRCAIASFGFVYIHPLADGNGRLHRFLVNDSLRRDGAIKAPMILPVSAVITDDAGERRNYDRVLDSISKPLMEAVRDEVQFSPAQIEYPDGVFSNMTFMGNAQARPLWRYPDLGEHVQFMSSILYRTLTEQMREESRYLRSHSRMKDAIKEVVEMPDHQADRLIRSFDQNQGELSNVLAKEMPVLKEPGVWDAIQQALAQVSWSEGAPARAVTERYRPDRPPARG